MKKIVIVGGGISGLCTAYYLVKEGHEVSVVDKGDMTGGASYINAGYLTPSHFISLAEPGMITQGIKWMLNSASPFYIKPRWDPDFFKWAWSFKRASTHAGVERAIPLLRELNIRSRDLYLEMQEQAEFDFHLERKGLLMVYKTAKNKEHELKVADRARKEGLEAQILDQEELHTLEPAFADDVLGAVRYNCDAHSTPHLFMEDMKKYLSSKGVQFFKGEGVTGFHTSAKEIKAVTTENHEITGDEFVLAAGVWTFKLAKLLGLHIPIQGGKGYSLNMAETTGINMPAILTEAKCAVTPMKSFTRFAGTMEFSGNNEVVRSNRVQAIAAAAERYYDKLKVPEQVKQEAISGLRPVSPDGLPYIGPARDYKNLYIASGHAMMGWSLGPVTGKIIADLIDGKEVEMNINMIATSRFSK